MNKPLYIVGILIILGFAVLSAVELIKTQTPYVHTVEEVKKEDREVQFLGTVIVETAEVKGPRNELVFVMEDENGEKMPIRYKGVKPANFDTANQAVVRGKFYEDEFVATQLLLKCPSKYESEEK